MEIDIDGDLVLYKALDHLLIKNFIFLDIRKMCI